MRHSFIGEFASGVLLNLFIFFHMSFPSTCVLAPSSTSLQLSVLASFMASLASLHVSIHSVWLVLMVCRNRLRVRILT